MKEMKAMVHSVQAREVDLRRRGSVESNREVLGSVGSVSVVVGSVDPLVSIDVEFPNIPLRSAGLPGGAPPAQSFRDQF
eukprot:2649993-Alexandrium_andersonii.AAC.1